MLMKTIQIAPVDNVAVALCPINAGETVQSGDLSQVVVTEAIPQGHKIALKILQRREYYQIWLCDRTCNDRHSGRKLVHTHNMATNLSGEIEYSYHPELKQRHQKNRSVLTDSAGKTDVQRSGMRSGSFRQ